jgi:dipeptidyl-peptidase-4
LKISPDGSRVTYLKGKADDKDRLDLWEYNIHDRQARVLVDSKTLAPKQEKLSDEEIGRRERQRTAALSGILEYTFAPAGDAVLFPLNGKLYYYQLATKKQKAAVELIDTHGFATDATVSPAGGTIAYVRDQNLHAYDIGTKTEKALSSDGGGAIKNGMAEFIAQEEMDRSTGYWWAPDGKHIAFARVDESPIKVTERFEISADNVATFAQRYPTTGGPNVLVRLGVVDIQTGTVVWTDLGTEQDIYLARVNWLPDGKTLAIQRESRNQRKLELLFADIDTGKVT